MRHHHAVPIPDEADQTLLLMPAWQPGRYFGLKVVNVAPRYARLKTEKSAEIYGWQNIELISDRPFKVWIDEEWTPAANRSPRLPAEAATKYAIDDVTAAPVGETGGDS